MTQEERAIHIVMRYERDHNRDPKDVSKKHVVYDIESSGRLIEVKSRIGKGTSFVFLKSTLITKLTDDQKKRYYIYYVELRDEPILTIIPPEEIFINLKAEILYHLPGKVIHRLQKHKLLQDR